MVTSRNLPSPVNQFLFHQFKKSEGTYTTRMSVWNPLQGFLHSKLTTIKVMERIGPIFIDDFQQVTDSVSGN